MNGASLPAGGQNQTFSGNASVVHPTPCLSFTRPSVRIARLADARNAAVLESRVRLAMPLHLFIGAFGSHIRARSRDNRPPAPCRPLITLRRRTSFVAVTVASFRFGDEPCIAETTRSPFVWP